MLQEAVLGRGRGLHKSAFCCNPPFSAAPSPAGIGRLLQSAVLGSAAAYTKRAFAAIHRSRQRRALHKLVACSIRPFLAAPRPAGTGRLLQSAVLGRAPALHKSVIYSKRQPPPLAAASPLSRSQFPRNLSKYTFNGQALARFPRNLWITARRPPLGTYRLCRTAFLTAWFCTNTQFFPYFCC